jgi:Transmembrane protein 43
LTTLKHSKSYTYDKVWSRTLADSTTFDTQSGNENPTQYEVDPLELQAHDMLVGEAGLYSLGQTARAEITLWERWTTAPFNRSKIETMQLPSRDSSTSVKLKPDGDEMYVGFNLSDPAIGDTRRAIQQTVATSANKGTVDRVRAKGGSK